MQRRGAQRRYVCGWDGDGDVVRAARHAAMRGVWLRGRLRCSPCSCDVRGDVCGCEVDSGVAHAVRRGAVRRPVQLRGGQRGGLCGCEGDGDVLRAAARGSDVAHGGCEARGDGAHATERGVATRRVRLRGPGACDWKGVGDMAMRLRGACGWEGDGDGAHPARRDVAAWHVPLQGGPGQ